MSRVGKMPIDLPEGVSISQENGMLSVNGPKGSLERQVLPSVEIKIADGQLTILRENDEPKTRAAHGLMRALINNMVVGVSTGFEKKLEINGVGYRVQQAGDSLRFSLGFSHELTYKIPQGIQIAVQQNVITVQGIDKQQVGQVAAEIRALRKPEPYKGKGIKYADERIIRKSGKSGKE